MLSGFDYRLVPSVGPKVVSQSLGENSSEFPPTTEGKASPKLSPKAIYDKSGPLPRTAAPAHNAIEIQNRKVLWDVKNERNLRFMFPDLIEIP